MIIDVGLGNSGSVSNMLKYLGIDHFRSNKKKDLESASKIILPGVGSFDSGLRALKEAELIQPLKEIPKNKNKMILGICLGMQMLFQSSDEGELPGLGLLKGNATRFKFNQTGLKVPHMGWNKIDLRQKDIFNSDYTDSKFYFVHSYHVNCEDDSDILATTDYGYNFTSAVMRSNVLGVQFHPEKSHKYGLRLLADFIDL